MNAVVRHVWSEVHTRSTKKQIEDKRGILSYKTRQNYQSAFSRAFQIYYHRRCWKFKDNAVPDIRNFVQQKDFSLVCHHVGGCHDAPVKKSTMFIKTKSEFEPRMMMTIDFDQFPVQALPLHVLRWWLLARGVEVPESDPIHHLMLRAQVAQKLLPISADQYKTTYSNLLQRMMGTTPRIPAVHWVGTP